MSIYIINEVIIHNVYFFCNWTNKLLSEENKVTPRTLFEAREVAGSATLNSIVMIQVIQSWKCLFSLFGHKRSVSFV